jgi:hypothetical protein
MVEHQALSKRRSIRTLRPTFSFFATYLASRVTGPFRSVFRRKLDFAFKAKMVALLRDLSHAEAVTSHP